MGSYKKLVLPEKLSEYRVLAIIYRPKETMNGVKMGQFLLQKKDGTYYDEFAGKITCFGTQVYQKDETAEEALARNGTELRKKEKPLEALCRRLRKEIPDVADKITSKIRHWKGLRLPRQQIPGEYYCDVFVRIVRDLKEMSDITDGTLGKGTRQGLTQVMTREQVERMIKTSPDDFMMGAGIVIEDFLEALDRGEFNDY